MLSNHCGRKWSSRKSIPRRPTYSSLSRYPKSSCKRVDEHHSSPSISVSDENQKLTANTVQTTIANESNGTSTRRDHRQTSEGIRKARDYGRSVSRGSNSSQLTLMTSISKGYNEGNNNVTAACVNECLLKIQRPTRAAVSFGKASSTVTSDTVVYCSAFRFSPERFFQAENAVKPGVV